MRPLFFFFLTSPLIFNPFGLKGYLLPKLWWVALGLVLESFLLMKEKKKGALSLLSTLFLFYLLVLIVSSAFSLSPLLAFKGSYERFEGILTFSFFALFLILAENSQEKNFKLSWVLFPGLLVVLLAFLQKIYPPLFSESDRAFSTLGQPNFLGAYLLMLFPFALALKMPHSLLAALFLLGGIALTFSRAALLSLPLLLFLFFLLKPEEKKLYFLLFLLALFLFFLLFFTSPLFHKRITYLAQRKDATARVRLLLWDKSLHLLSPHLFLGLGPENFAYAFFKERPVAFNALESPASSADRAHNLFLDEAFRGGMAGFFFFTLLLFITFFALLKKKRENKEAAFLLLSLASFLLVHLVSFPTLIPFLFLLFIMSTTSLTRKPAFPSFLPLMLSFSFFIFFSLYNFCDLLAKQGQSTMASQASSLALPPLRLASRLIPFEPEYTHLLGQAALYAYSQSKNRAYLLEGKKALQKTVKLTPYDPFAYANLALLYTRLSLSSKEFEKKAEKAFSQALALFPTNPAFYHQWGIFISERGKLKKGLSLLQKARELDHKNPLILADIGLLYQRMGKYELSKKYLLKSLAREKNLDTLNHLGITFIKAGKIKEAKAVFLQALELDPDNARAYNNLGAVYMKTGDKKKAEEAFSRALELDTQGSMGKLAAQNLKLLKTAHE